MSPASAPHGCVPGCPVLVYGPGRCAAHTRQREQDRGSANARGYDAVWQRVRRQVLSESPLCVHCEARGDVTLATDVHHIVRVRVDTRVRLDRRNLVPLCQACHSRVTMREDVGDRR